MLGRGGDGRLSALPKPDNRSTNGKNAVQPVGYQINPGREAAGADREAQPSRRSGQRGNGALMEAAPIRRDEDRPPVENDRVKQRDRAPIDRGAAQLVAIMKETMGGDDAANFRTSIALRSLRNQSRTAPEEIDELRDRLLALLSDASLDEGLRFTREVGDATEYTLSGTVYLIQRDGFDQWEIYFALRPVDANWTIWRNDDPVRMLRQKRAGGDSIQFVREP